jgi:hypothetical protein
VPEWKHLHGFTNHLKGLHIPGFEHISDHKESDLVENIPLWSTVHLAPLVKQAKLDLDGLAKAMVDRIGKLVAEEEKITKLISKVRQRAV